MGDRFDRNFMRMLMLVLLAMESNGDTRRFFIATGTALAVALVSTWFANWSDGRWPERER